MKKEGVREVTCILCPVGCKARVTTENEEAPKVENVDCPRGEDYVLRELRAPMRDFFTTVRVRGARIPVLPVRAISPIPKGKMAECASELAKITVDSPVKMGDVVVKNILNLGVDIVATREC
jgi:CxxC motif-containing protein